MFCHRLIRLSFIALTLSGRLPGQTVAPQPTSDAHILAMTVPNGTPLPQIALDKEVRVKDAGEQITGRVMQPVYVFDRLVIPVGTVANGRIGVDCPGLAPYPGFWMR